MADGVLTARFLRGLATSPEGVAIRVEDETVTYARAHAVALEWAGALLALPGGPPRAVSVLAGRTVESYLGILACLYAGVPVVPLLADFPPERIGQMLEAADVSALIVDAQGAAVLPELSPLPVGDGKVTVLAPWVGKAVEGPFDVVPVDPRDALAEPRATAEPGDVAYVLFTSGSTGRPKGVRLTHGNLHHYFTLMDEWYDFTAADVFSQAANLNWDSAVSDLWCAWGAGATLVSVPPPAYRDIPGFVARHGITVWFSAPSVIALVRKTGRLVPDSMPTLRWTYFGGEALQCRDTDDWQRAAPGSAVINVYGPTEMTITTHRHTWSPELSPRRGINGVVPLGRLHDGHAELLLDERGEPDEVEGELWLAGPQLSDGYLDPADGAGKYLRRDGRTWYRTGDRVRRIDGGELIYLGRVDSQVQVQGYRVELAEIEHALRSCAPVQDAVVVGVPVAGTTELFAFYLGEEVAARELAAQLARKLPQQMIPRHYQPLRQFPLNVNKKIDRLALAARAAESRAAA
ncbi:AMP-binding protein [Rhizomonospora bruguierae]|uniref:AMP-binding protein n=1 Tax=Rhizomonospora bruguierae TaxID=1581705 RepID=UPI00278C8E68|nr:AMP-binding protein [Micromonospora sp. NBRC 107566]